MVCFARFLFWGGSMIFVGQKSSFWNSDVPRKRGLNLSMLEDGCCMFHSELCSLWSASIFCVGCSCRSQLKELKLLCRLEEPPGMSTRQLVLADAWCRGKSKKQQILYIWSAIPCYAEHFSVHQIIYTDWIRITSGGFTVSHDLWSCSFPISSESCDI